MQHKLVIFALLLFVLSGAANAIDISACTNISYSGTYTLTANIEEDPSTVACIEIKSNNTIFDCNGYFIAAWDTGFYTKNGLSVNDSSNITIKNCNLDQLWLNDLNVTNSRNLLFQNITFGTIGITTSENISIKDVSGDGSCISSGPAVRIANTKNLTITNSTLPCVQSILNDNLNFTNSTFTNDGCKDFSSVLSIESTNNSEIYFNNIFDVEPEVSCGDSLGSLLLIDNASNGNKIYNNRLRTINSLTQNGCAGGDITALGNIYVNFTGTFTENQDFFNTTKQTGARIYSNGSKIGGNYYEKTGCGSFGDLPNTQGYSSSCADANTDGFCDVPFELNGTLITDYLPYSNKAVSFTMRTFDESTGTQIYFTATIVNSTNTTNTGYQFNYDETPYVLPTGSVSVVVSNTTYYQSKYIGTIPTTTDSHLDAYLQPLSNINVKQVSFLTTSASSQALPGVLVSINRLVNGVSVSVGNVYTDSTGMASFFMDSSISYTVTASMLGYSTVTQTIIPTQSTYTITMGNWTIGMFHQTFYDIQWTFSPTGILDENKTHNLTFSTFSSTGKIVWFAWKIYNGTTLLRFENVTSTTGGTINYLVLPGPNSNITLYFFIMRVNMSEQQLAIWWMPLPVQSFINGIIGDINRFITSNQTLTSVLKNLGNQANNWVAFPKAISSFTLVLGTLIVGVITSAWVGRLSPTGGLLVFVIVMAVGAYMEAGILASISLLIFIIIVAVAYQLWRSGG
jgi:hypothetical protein